MRIALVHFCSLPVVGGVELVMGEHARLFADEGHEVTILCRRGASADARIRVQLLADEDEAKNVAHLESELAAQDVVFVHNVLTMPFAPAWTAALWPMAYKLPAVRFVSWVHDVAACNPDYVVPEKSLLREAAGGFLHVAVSDHRQAQFEALTGVVCRVIPNGIDPARLLPLSANVAALADELGLFGPGLVLLHPTRLLRRKNIELSLKVAAALKARHFDFHFLVTAPPDAQNPASQTYAQSLRQLREDLEVEAEVLFLHDHFEVGPEDLQSLYRLADALFFPSHQEGFGLPIIEAGLHRLPIFCADIAPVNRLLEGAPHLFAPESDPAKIAALIMRILGEAREIQTRKRVYGDYAWPIIYQKYLAPLLSENAF